MKITRRDAAAALRAGPDHRPKTVPGPGFGTRGGRGLTLVELVISLSICALVLASAWPWCWRVSGVAAASQRRTQVASALAYAQRTFCADVRRASSIAAPPEAECSVTKVTLEMLDPLTGVRERVTYAYDPTRHVVWRKAPGTYLVERVDACRFLFYDAGGAEIAAPAGEPLAAGLVADVRRIRLVVSVDPTNAAVEEWPCDASLRALGS
jgi:type II secretory pathway pseudopilin PulG